MKDIFVFIFLKAKMKVEKNPRKFLMDMNLLVNNVIIRNLLTCLSQVGVCYTHERIMDVYIFLKVKMKVEKNPRTFLVYFLEQEQSKEIIFSILI